jgi:cell division cycle 14
VATITAVAASHVIEFDVQSFLQAIQDDVSSLAKALRVLNKAYRQSCKNSKPAHRHYRWQQQQQKVCKANCATQAPTACIDFATAQGHGRLEHQLCKHQVTPADAASHASSGTPLSLTVSSGPSGDIFSSEPCANVDFQDFGTVFPIIPGRLSFAVHRTEQETRRDIANFPNIYFFSSNLHESYEAYSYDFGPVNLAAVFEFCQQMQEKLGDPRLAERAVCYYSESCVKLRTNAAFLLGAFLIVCRGMTAEEALRPFEAMGSSAFNPFRDATNVHPPTFFLSLRDCFAGLQRAVSASWFDLKTFDFETYCLVDNPDTYDLSRICTKFIAFRGPDVRDQNLRNPEHYFGLFHKMDVTDIVRLNEPDCYDKFTVCPYPPPPPPPDSKEPGVHVLTCNHHVTDERVCLYVTVQFEQEGIKVHDLEFQDCTTPSSAIVEEFLKLVDKSKGVVAVHCLAGLGRTGTLISLWIMSRLGWSARECIAWLRIVRPGSVLGAQQQYLEECQHALASGKPLPEPDAKEEASAASVAQSVAQAMYDRRHRHILRCSSSSSAAAGGGSGCAEEEEEEETDAFARRQHHQRHHQPHRHTHRRTPHAHTHASANHVPLHSERSCGSGSSSVCSSSYSASSAISNKGSGCDMFGHQLVRHTSNTSDSSSTWSADGFHEFHRDVFQHRHDSSELQFFPDEDDDLGSDQDGVAELMLSMDWSPNNQNSASDIRV